MLQAQLSKKDIPVPQLSVQEAVRQVLQIQVLEKGMPIPQLPVQEGQVPAPQVQALEKVTETTKFDIRKDIYNRFFSAVSAGQVRVCLRYSSAIWLATRLT